MAQACTKKGIYYYIAPSYVMGKQIAWRLLKELGGDHFVNKNESELFVEFENGAVIQIKGAENRDSLRGVSLAGAVIDEAAFMAQEVWTEVVRPSTQISRRLLFLFLHHQDGTGSKISMITL